MSKERNCTTCWHSVLLESTATGLRKRTCLRNDGMQVNRRMCCEEYDARTTDERPVFATGVSGISTQKTESS